MKAPSVCIPHTTVKEALQCALDLLQDPLHWLRGVYAMNSQGIGYSETGVIERIWETDREEPPESFCLVGAVRFCAKREIQGSALSTVVAAINRCCPKLGVFTLTHQDIPDFNDSPRVQHDHVLRVLEEAIDVASAEGE